MAILDLDKINIQRTVLGIRCTACAGNLVEQRNVLLKHTMRIVSVGTCTARLYECHSCKKKHLLLY